jgi:hypothetical protein
MQRQELVHREVSERLRPTPKHRMAPLRRRAQHVLAHRAFDHQKGKVNNNTSAAKKLATKHG